MFDVYNIIINNNGIMRKFKWFFFNFKVFIEVVKFKIYFLMDILFIW